MDDKGGTSKGSSSRGREMNPQMDNFDPMAEAYKNVEFNSYPSGPGANVKQSMQVESRRRGDSSNFKIYAGNIPLNINESGLRNIFSTVGEPLKIYLSMKPGAKYKWAFVEFKTLSEAQRAVTSLNKLSPHNLIVQFAIGEEEKAERKRHQKEAQAIQNQEPRPLPPGGVGFGRGLLPPMKGVPPKNVRGQIVSSTSSNNNYSNMNGINTGYSVEQFQHYQRDPIVDSATNVIGNMTMSVSSDGSRSVSLGRGSFCGDDKASDSRAFRHPFYRTNFQEKASELAETSVHCTGQQNGLYYYKNEPKLQPKGPCGWCKEGAIFMCSVCKSLYCSYSCMTQDYDLHKNKCRATLEVGDQRSEFRNFIDEAGSDTFSARHNESSDKEKDFEMMADLRNRNDRNNTVPGNRYPNINKTTFVRNPPGRLNKNKRDFSNAQTNSNEKNGKASEFLLRRPQEDVFNPPVSKVTFTEVEITVVDEPDVYWVQDVSKLKQQVDIIKILNAHCNYSKNYKSVTPNVGFLYAAPYFNEWFRAKVLQVEPELKVHFIDFGNQETCPKEKLLNIPDELMNIPPLAFKIHLAEGTSSKHIGLTEFTRLNIMPVSKDTVKDAWIVHVEGDSYPEPCDDLESSPIPFDSFEKVKIMFASSKSDYWVQRVSDFKDFIKMSSCLGDCSAIKITPVLGETYVHKYKGDTWCRVKVICSSPLKGFYIDYGITGLLNGNVLHPVPAAYKDVPPMAFHIRLSEETSSKYFGMSDLDSLSVKAVNKLDEDVYIVQVEGETYRCNIPNVENIQRRPKQNNRSGTNHVLFMLEDGKEVKLMVEKVVSDDHLIGTLLIPGSSSSLGYLTNDEISKRLSSIKFSDRFYPKLGDMVCVEHGGINKRGYVMSLWRNEFSVALVDYGHVIKTCGPVAPLRKEFQLIPEAGVRCLLETPVLHGTKLVGKVLSCKFSSYQNGILSVDVNNFGKAEIVAWEPFPEEAGLMTVTIPSGCKVIISAFHSPQALYIQSLEQENIEMLAILLQDVATHCLKANPLKRSPLTGELIACKFKADGSFYRAQVTKKVDDRFEVTFVDYGNTEVISISNMRTLPLNLKSVPCCAIKIGLKGVPRIGFSPGAMTLLNELSASSTELFITYENDDLSAATLVCKTGMALNETLNEFAQPRWKKALENGRDPSEGHVFMASDLQYTKWTRKSKTSIMILGERSHNEKLATSTTFEYLIHVSKTLLDQINEYAVATSSDESYNPRVNELCIAKYDGDGKWYRAVCTKILSSTSEIMFVDYGNVGEVAHTNIRRMTSDFVSSPAILKCCKIYGIPDKLPENIIKELRAILSDGSTHQAEVVEDSFDCSAIVWIPDLNYKLVQLGLKPVESPFAS